MQGIYTLIIVICLIFSAYFSATETAFSSLNRTRLKTMAEKGEKRAILACKLSDQYDKLISTILIGNNIVNILAASVGTMLFVSLYGDAGATISTIVLTILVLIFGEVSPKSIAKDCPEKFAMFSAPFIHVLMAVFTPLNFLFSQWKKLLARVFHLETSSKMSQDELLMLVNEVQQDGSIDENEGDLLKNAIEFTDLEAADILIHRVELAMLPVDATKEEVAAMFTETRYSRLLVYEGSIDHILGVVLHKDFYVGSGITDKPLRQIVSPVLFVLEHTRIRQILKRMQKAKTQLAVVLDEYGGTCGIVTMEDILEELVGEIWDEHDDVVEDIRPLPDGGFCVKGDVRLDDMLEFFHIDKEYDVVSVGGWAQQELGAVPQTGDRFEAEGLEVTITATEMRRVTEILVRPAADEPREERP